jgi:class 3 adenylate cyclase/tetratricopeptide (TPR) repeat protein/type II secretory pathway predicted ATPase ExeA
MSNIEDWLGRLNLDRYCQVFTDNDIDLSVLPYLDDTQLEKLGVSMGHRVKILNAAKALDPDEFAPQTTDVSQPPPAERRQLTVMFTDLAGSTQLSLQLDPEELRELNLVYQQITTQSIEKFGGYVARYMGDGVLAYFGYPQAHEDDADRSILAGLDLLQEFSQTPSLTNLHVRLGIATGLVVVGDLIGEGASQETAVVGETPNLAARLQSHAELNTLLVSDATYALAKDKFEFSQRSDLQLKGYVDSIVAWRVLAEKSLESRFQAKVADSDSGFIGRSEELLTLRALWRKSVTACGQTVLIRGEAGIGKSRLVEELFKTIRQSNAITIRYQCSPHHTNSPFFPFSTQVRRAASIDSTDSDASSREKLSALIRTSGASRQLVLDMLSLLVTSDRDSASNSTDTAVQQKSKMVNALCDELASLCKNSSVLVIVEDAHWIDPSSLETLTRLVDFSQSQSVLIVVTTRPQFQCPWREAKNSHEITLDRLSRADSLEIARNVAARHVLNDEMIHRINQQSDGVPLFVEEITKTVLELNYRNVGPGPDDAATDYLSVPTSLKDSLMARLDHLGPAKHLAQVASVIGREFTESIVASLHDDSQQSLKESLARLVSSGLVLPHHGGEKTSYQFNHALVRDTAYDSMLISKRKSIHSKLARVLESNAAEAPEVIAYHYECGGENENALNHWREAGENAALRSANLEAVSHFQQALDCINEIPEDRQQSTELQLQLALGAASIAPKGYASSDVLTAFSRALQLAELIGHAESKFSSTRGVWSNKFLRAELDNATTMANKLLSLSKQTEDPLQELMANRVMGVTCMGNGNYLEAMRHFDLALERYSSDMQEVYISRWGEDPGLFCMVYRAWMNDWLGQRDEAVAQLDDTISLARALPNRYGLSHVLAMASLVYQLRNDTQKVLSLTDAAIELSTEQGVQWLAWSNVHRGWALAKTGETDIGIRICANGIEDIKKTGTRFPLPHLLPLLADILIDRGDLESAKYALDEAVNIVNAANCGHLLPELHKTIAVLECRHGNTNLAAASFKEALAVSRTQQASTLELKVLVALQQHLPDSTLAQDELPALQILVNVFNPADTTKDIVDAHKLISATVQQLCIQTNESIP